VEQEDRATWPGLSRVPRAAPGGVKAPSAELVEVVAKEQPASGARAAADNPAVVACPEVVVAAEAAAFPAAEAAEAVVVAPVAVVAAVAADADKRGADYEERTEKIKGVRYESTSLYKEW
jgi:hypothetical protein